MLLGTFGDGVFYRKGCRSTQVSHHHKHSIHSFEQFSQHNNEFQCRFFPKGLQEMGSQHAHLHWTGAWCSDRRAADFKFLSFNQSCNTMIAPLVFHLPVIHVYVLYALFEKWMIAHWSHPEKRAPSQDELDAVPQQTWTYAWLADLLLVAR